MGRPRTLAVVGALGTLIAAWYVAISGTWSGPPIPSPAADAVVVAELFTSKGCSSCLQWKSEDLKVIAFVQEQTTRRIVGAGFSNVAARSEAP